MDIFGKIRSTRSSMPEVDLNQGRSIAYSRSTTTRLMDVLDANGRGNVHGGVIMRVVDESAAIVAIKHARRPVVTNSSGYNLKSRQGLIHFALKIGDHGSLSASQPALVFPYASIQAYSLQR
jgi:Thioesterase superfamily